ncbi:unnamed protein product [Meganyctiphanes norvegica]|uniref:Uncharacterized protein n=1 Tax=Meganyctiphanes norvegica TaxID=48144 RepID=A0AAV2QXX4_MEGNR
MVVSTLQRQEHFFFLFCFFFFILRISCRAFGHYGRDFWIAKDFLGQGSRILNTGNASSSSGTVLIKHPRLVTDIPGFRRGVAYSPSKPWKEISLRGKSTEKVDDGDIQGNLGDPDPWNQSILNVRGACTEMNDDVGETESDNHVLAAL